MSVAASVCVPVAVREGLAVGDGMGVGRGCPRHTRGRNTFLDPTITVGEGVLVRVRVGETVREGDGKPVGVSVAVPLGEGVTVGVNVLPSVALGEGVWVSPDTVTVPSLTATGIGRA